MLELVIGGARSGKSAYAERQALQSGLNVVYIATATAGDDEMQQRIAHHQQNRPVSWLTIEEPVYLEHALRQARDAFVIVDCLTLWMSNLFSLSSHLRGEQIDRLFALIPDIKTDIVFVSNEIGMGVVPMGESTRRFVDEIGWLHQRLAALCQRVTQVTVGLANRLKDE